jgi:iron complex transport system substrate-binding protein
MRGVLPVETMTQAEIDVELTRRLHNGEPIYEIDAECLRSLSPDLVITQELCEVCAASPKDLAAALAILPTRPEIVQLTPRSLGDVLENILQLGTVTGRSSAAAEIVGACEARIDAVRDRAARVKRRPRVFCMEWLDPPYCSGHWVPEMVEIAGGVDQLSRKGADSVRVKWEEILAWQPEVLVVMPCGYELETVQRHAEELATLPGWWDLPAVRNGRVFAAHANAYFARPGPRLVEGVELLAHLIHPELFGWTGHDDAYAVLRTKRCAKCSTPFLCRPAPGCWCESINLPAGTAGTLAGQSQECLCPSCLAAVSCAIQSDDSKGVDSSLPLINKG